MKAEVRKALAAGIAHVQHSLRCGDLPLNAAQDLLGHVNVALESKLTKRDAALCNMAMSVADDAHKAHRRSLDEGRRFLARTMQKAFTITAADRRAADKRAKAARGVEATRDDGGAEA